MKVIAGIDEAGRGPIFGPLIIAGVAFLKEKIPKLLEYGIKDSKQLSAKKRETLSQIIKDEAKSYCLIKITPQEIDQALKNDRDNLNKLEIRKFFEIIQKLKSDVFYVDAVSKPVSFSSVFKNYSQKVGKSCFTVKNIQKIPYTGQGQVLHLPEDEKTIIVENKADRIYPIVGAASILAKVERDQIVADLSQKFGDLGSGYPSDPRTKDFLFKNKDNLRQPEFQELVRFQWKTVQKLLEKANIVSLETYLSKE
ncbi:MAG: ribonuclease HII [Candidatus Hermodarchaeota archaeon]